MENKIKSNQNTSGFSVFFGRRRFLAWVICIVLVAIDAGWSAIGIFGLVLCMFKWGADVEARREHRKITEEKQEAIKK